MAEYMGTFVRPGEAVLPSRSAIASYFAPNVAGRRRPAWVVRYVALTVLADAGAAILATMVVYLLRFGDSDGRYLVSPMFVAALWVVSLVVFRAYDVSRFGNGTDEYRAVAKAALGAFTGVALTSYILSAQISRAMTLGVLVLALAMSLVVHWASRTMLLHAREAGRDMLATIVVGRADSVATMIREFNGSRGAGYQVIGACVSGLDTGWDRTDTVEGVPVLGPPERALFAADQLGVDVVAVSSHPDLVGHALRRLSWALAERRIDLVVSPGIVEVAGPRLSLRPAAGLSLLHVDRPGAGGARVVFKRIFDFVAAAIITALVSPILLTVALAIKLTSPGPVFFRQERAGAEGTPFRMIKFRSMVPDAEVRLKDMDRAGQVNAKLFKDPDDPRITPVGRFIRRYSIDELPQLFNVLKGEMSLIGPRPPLFSEVETYESDAFQRLRVRPGMTGLWQISGRSDLDWEQSLRLDLWYVDNWTPMLDLQIMVRTARAVLGSSGAY